MHVALRYIEHLSEQDLSLIGRVGGSHQGPREFRSHLQEHPEAIERLLASPRLLDAVLSEDGNTLASRVSPFLSFAALVHQTAREIHTAAYIPEWAGPRRRLPVFDVMPVREFLSSGANRLFLIELLTSFVKVASGSMWVRTRRGYRRRRYSELDPLRLAEMVEHLPLAQRSGGYRRLGDVTLFLTGVFPDHTATHVPTVWERERLAASAGVAPMTALDDGSDLRFHEIVGANWYRRAVATAKASAGVGPVQLLEIAEEFTLARRVLNVLTDRHLYRYDTGLVFPTG